MADCTAGQVPVVELEDKGVLHTKVPRKQGVGCAHLKIMAKGRFGDQELALKVLIDSGSDV